MPTAVFAAFFIISLLVAGLIIMLRDPQQKALNAAERAELERLRGLRDRLQDTAWDHRELDSTLATIVLDEIRSSERQGQGPKELS